MTTPSQPENGRCARCGRTGPVFPAEAAWGRVESPLCSTHWQVFAQARDAQTYVDWNDAFDNAPDNDLEKGIRREP